MGILLRRLSISFIRLFCIFIWEIMRMLLRIFIGLLNWHNNKYLRKLRQIQIAYNFISFLIIIFLLIILNVCLIWLYVKLNVVICKKELNKLKWLFKNVLKVKLRHNLLFYWNFLNSNWEASLIKKLQHSLTKF